jgi:glycosyltransferase involved in cell wall biosynthesis
MSLVLPAYNPGPRLEATWREVVRFLDETPGRWEVLFVCDGCTDGTPERLRHLVLGESDRVRLISYTPNRGKGYAVRQGLLAARGAFRLFTDVDLAYGFGDVMRVADALRTGAEVAIASRTHPDSRVTMPVGLQGYAYRRHLQSLIFASLARLLLPLTQHDPQAGLKGLSARAVQLIVPQLQCDGFGFDCELLTACVCHGISITEIPVNVRYEDTVSTTGLRTMGQMLADLVRIRNSWRQPRAVPALIVETGQRGAA